MVSTPSFSFFLASSILAIPLSLSLALSPLLPSFPKSHHQTLGQADDGADSGRGTVRLRFLLVCQPPRFSTATSELNGGCDPHYQDARGCAQGQSASLHRPPAGLISTLSLGRSSWLNIGGTPSSYSCYYPRNLVGMWSLTSRMAVPASQQDAAGCYRNSQPLPLRWLSAGRSPSSICFGACYAMACPDNPQTLAQHVERSNTQP